MTFQPPDLDTNLTNVGVLAKINAQLTLIERAFQDISNELPLVVGSQSFVANFSAFENLIRPSGILGRDSFVPSFTTDEDVFSIVHDTEDGWSACTIKSRYHRTNTPFSHNLSVLCTGDGVWELVFGAQTVGAPYLEQHLYVLDSDNGLVSESWLPIWSFTVVRSGSTYQVSNLRLLCDVLAAKVNFSDLLDFEHPLCWSRSGTLPTADGVIGTGIVIPWDCEVLGAKAHLLTPPSTTDGLRLDFYTGWGTDSETVCEGAEWSSSQGNTVVSCAALSPTKILTSGSFVYPHLTLPDTGGAAANLSVTLLLKRIWHDVI